MTIQNQPTATLEHIGDHLIGYVEPIDDLYYRFTVTETPEFSNSNMRIGETLAVDRAEKNLHVIGVYTAMANKKGQIDLIKFALKYPRNWHSFADDKETVELICATSNLGIIKINEHGQFMLKSKLRAEQYLGAL